MDAGLFEFYRLLIEDAGALRAARRETNNFFMTLSTGGLGAVGYLISEGLEPAIIALLCGTMLIINFIWWNAITHYARLVTIKFQVIKKLEDQLPFQPTQEEWALFAKGKRDKGSSHIEKFVPLLFAIGYAGFALLQLGQLDLAGGVGSLVDMAMSPFR
jgi:hypothetical protein